MIWSNITWHAIVWYDKWLLWYAHRHSIYPSLRHLPLWPRIPAPVEADERWRYTGGGFDTRRGWPNDIFESNSAFRDKQKSSCFRMYSVKSYDSDPWSNGLLKESDWWLPQISGLPLRPSDRCRSSATCASLRFRGKTWPNTQSAHWVLPGLSDEDGPTSLDDSSDSDFVRWVEESKPWSFDLWRWHCSLLDKTRFNDLEWVSLWCIAFRCKCDYERDGFVAFQCSIYRVVSHKWTDSELQEASSVQLAVSLAFGCEVHLTPPDSFQTEKICFSFYAVLWRTPPIVSSHTREVESPWY